MRKILTLIVMLVTLCSCDKDIENHGPKKQTFYVHVYNSPQKFAEPSMVFLFKDNGKTLNHQKSAVSVKSENKLTYLDRTTSEKFKFLSPSLTGENTFKSIPSGKYILWVLYTPDGSASRSLYKNIIVDHRFNLNTVEFNF